MTDIENSPSALEFPCEFPVKIIGYQTPEFQAIAIKILHHHFPQLPEETITMRASKDGKYLALTAVVHATNKNTLDALYYELTQTKEILMAL